MRYTVGGHAGVAVGALAGGPAQGPAGADCAAQAGLTLER